MDGLETDVARLAFRVVCVAAAVNLFADLLVAAAPVVVLACGVAVSGFAPHTPWVVIEVQWGGKRGAVCEEHGVYGVK